MPIRASEAANGVITLSCLRRLPGWIAKTVSKAGDRRQTSFSEALPCLTWR